MAFPKARSYTQRIVAMLPPGEIPRKVGAVVVNSGPQGPPGMPGPPGPQGPQGPSGGAASSYFFTQVEPASSWLINHNLGFRPNVTIEEEGTGQMIMAGEIHHSVNQLELQFNTPRAGTARLS